MYQIQHPNTRGRGLAKGKENPGYFPRVDVAGLTGDVEDSGASSAVASVKGEGAQVSQAVAAGVVVVFGAQKYRSSEVLSQQPGVPGGVVVLNLELSWSLFINVAQLHVSRET